MIRRIAVAGACAAVALMLVPTPAMAKGLTRVTVTGPGLSKPISLGMEGSNQLWPASGISPTNTAAGRSARSTRWPGSGAWRGRASRRSTSTCIRWRSAGPGSTGRPDRSGPGSGDPFPTGWWQPQREFLGILVRGGLGLGTAEVAGPGLASPIRMASGGTSGYAWLTDLYLLIDDDQGVFGKPQWTSLGPRYVATVHQPGGGVLTQYLYPYAETPRSPSRSCSRRAASAGWAPRCRPVGGPARSR